MEVWESVSIPLIGGSTVTIQLVEMPNWDEAPNMEISTRFVFPIEGEAIEWGFATVLSDFLTGDYMEQEYRQEVARWEKLRATPTKEEGTKDEN